MFNQDSYYQQKFSNQLATNQIVEGKEFEKCSFDHIEWMEVTFKNCSFIDCRFNNCLLTALKFPQSRFIDTLFKDSKVIGCLWIDVQFLSGLSLKHCDVSYSNFSGLTIPKLTLLHCLAKETSFVESNVVGSNFQNTDFLDSRFHNTNLERVDFKGAKNYAIDPKTNNITGAVFSVPEVLHLLSAFDIKIEDQKD